MAVAGTVVGQGPLLRGRLDVLQPGGDPSFGVARPLRVGDRNRALENVEGLACVSGGEAHEVFERLTAERDAAGWAEVAGETPLRVRKGAPDDGRDLIVTQGLEAIDA